VRSFRLDAQDLPELGQHCLLALADGVAPMPKKPPSFAALAASWAAWMSHSRKLFASSGVAFALRISFVLVSSSTTC
jgi:hypothetical protein